MKKALKSGSHMVDYIPKDPFSTTLAKCNNVEQIPMSLLFFQ